MQFMQRYGKTIQIGVTLAAGLVLMATAIRSQIPAVGPVWEFASVIGSTQTSYEVGSPENRATICYAGDSGCRNEQAAAKTNLRSGADAMMVAAARLGQKGWEMVATAESSNGSRIIYFKRLRSVLNRSEFPESR
jgi:hypothetical protein